MKSKWFNYLVMAIVVILLALACFFVSMLTAVFFIKVGLIGDKPIVSPIIGRPLVLIICAEISLICINFSEKISKSFFYWITKDKHV